MASSGTSARARTSSVTREAIVAAAMTIGERQGIEAITVRRIATELGVGAMTLYSYVRSKEEILDAIADVAMGGVVIPPKQAPTIEEAVRDVAEAFLTLMRENPAVIRLISTRITTSVDSHRGAMESVLRHLASAGIAPELCVKVYGFLITFALGFASYQAPRPWGAQQTPEALEQARQMTHFYAGLPSAQFPTTIALSDFLPQLPQTSTFWFAVDAVAAQLRETVGRSAD
jgi:AcrR family transcriptional regulator